MCAQKIDTKQFMRDLETKSPQDVANTYHIDIKQASELKGLHGKELESRVAKIGLMLAKPSR